jgi:hypothetical protein
LRGERLLVDWLDDIVTWGEKSRATSTVAKVTRENRRYTCRHARARMGFGLSRGFFGAPFRGWGDEFVGCAAAPRVDAGRRAGAGLAFDLTAAESAGRDALVKAVAAGGGGRRPALRNAPRPATLVSPGSQTARRCCAQSNIVVSPRQEKLQTELSQRPIQGWPHFLVGRLRPYKLVSGGARSSRPLCPFRQGGGQSDRSNLDGGV